MPTVEMDNARSLARGADVEVLVRFRQQWARGFEVAFVDDDGLWLRRRSDSVILPVAFAADEIRRTG